MAETERLRLERDAVVAKSLQPQEEAALRCELAVRATNVYWKLGGSSVDTHGLLLEVRSRLSCAMRHAMRWHTPSRLRTARPPGWGARL